jgi:hypothetical protein
MERQLPFWGDASHFSIRIARGLVRTIDLFMAAAWSCRAAGLAFTVSLCGPAVLLRNSILRNGFFTLRCCAASDPEAPRNRV